jgi:hypothetical protein
MSYQFFKQLENYIPTLCQFLDDGTSNTKRLDEETGYPIPDTLKALYSIHNGEKEMHLRMAIILFLIILKILSISLARFLLSWKQRINWIERFILP